MSKRSLSLTVWLAFLILFALSYLLAPKIYNGLEGQIRDTLFLYRGATKPNHKIIIADIDEKSLAALGQWPWSRNILANLLLKLHNMGAKAIAMDMVFPEYDRTSPKNPTAQTYDQQFANAIKATTPIIGFAFNMNDALSANNTEEPTATMIEHGQPSKNTYYQAKGIISNIPPIQSALTYRGFINMIPDASGVVRSTPLLIKYNDKLYPSFDMEIIRYIKNNPAIKVAYENGKIKHFAIGSTIIPVGSDSTMAINYRGGYKTFSYISVIDILQNKILPNVIKNSIVLIGTSATGLVDLRPTPFFRDTPGIEIHANIIDNILSGDFFRQPYWTNGFDAVVFVAIFSIAFMLFLSFDALWVFILFLISLFAIIRGILYILFDAHFLINVLLPFLALAFALLLSIWINYFYESKQKKRIKKAFSKKVSSSIINELLDGVDSDILKSQKRLITVFFSDIRGFTLITEELHSPQRLIKLLNSYITPMSEIISESKGTIDKYIGDAIMAYWNAPIELPNHADAALMAAIKQLDTLKSLNKDIKKEFGVEINIGIGIHTGEAIVGEVGSMERSDYTVIGHSVNLASRLEGLNKRYGTNLIISEQTKSALSNRYTFRELGKVHFRESDPLITIYEVICQGDAKQDIIDELAYYHRGLNYYYESKWEQAYTIFENLSTKSILSNKLYEYYKNRITAIKNNSHSQNSKQAEIL